LNFIKSTSGINYLSRTCEEWVGTHYRFYIMLSLLLFYLQTYFHKAQGDRATLVSGWITFSS